MMMMGISKECLGDWEESGGGGGNIKASSRFDFMFCGIAEFQCLGDSWLFR